MAKDIQVVMANLKALDQDAVVGIFAREMGIEKMEQ